MSSHPDHHAPLRDDVRLLGRLLGDALRSQEGKAFYEQVEAIRQWARQAVSGDPEARARLDRFLAECKPDVVKIGLSFFEAETTKIPHNDTDIPLDYCITPKGVISF